MAARDGTRPPMRPITMVNSSAISVSGEMVGMNFVSYHASPFHLTRQIRLSTPMAKGSAPHRHSPTKIGIPAAALSTRTRIAYRTPRTLRRRTAPNARKNAETEKIAM